MFRKNNDQDARRDSKAIDFNARRALRQQVTGVVPVSSFELGQMHPAVASWLSENNYHYEHEYILNTGQRVDFVAESQGGEVYMIECKRDCKDVVSAIDQVLGYCKGYESRAHPVIAVPTSTFTDYANALCERQGVALWPFDISVNEKRYRVQMKFWLNTNDPREQKLSVWLESLRMTRSFKSVVVDALELIYDLRMQKVDKLREIAPWLWDEGRR